MSFNDIKTFNGKAYSGMCVGNSHLWNYTNGVWEETKIAPDQWRFLFTSIKSRKVAAPENSGAPLNTSYHWGIIADQVVTKTSRDDYQTAMAGLKYKLGHKRAYWKGFSYSYPGQPTYRQQVIRMLRETLKTLEADELLAAKTEL